MGIGIIKEKGLISLDDKINKYLKGIHLENTTIKNLLEMSSGLPGVKIHWLLDMGVEYYGYNLTQQVYSLYPDKLIKPGEIFRYKNLNTQMLSLIIEKITKKPIYEFIHENILKYITTNDQEWCLDRVGNAKAFCCLYVTTEDFARIGKFILDNGVVNEKQLLSKEYIKEMWTPNPSIKLRHRNKPFEDNIFYGLQAWTLTVDGIKIDYFNGLQGQLLLVIRDWNVVVARFGHDETLGMRDPTERAITNIFKDLKKLLKK